jgi:diacylglycerol O-acyltransferase / wax synthase
MRETDAFAWYMENDPALRSTIVAVAFFDRPPEWERLVERAERATRLVPQFRQRIVVPPLRLATPRWVTDSNFDLTWHLRRIDAPAPHDRAAVLQLARTAAMDSFDRDRPLWTFTLIEGLHGGEAAMVMKVHHSLTDGLGGNQLALLVFDLQREAPEPGPMPQLPQPERHGAGDVVTDALATTLERAAGFVRHELTGVPGTTARAARHPFDTASRAAAMAASIYRMVQPVSATLSPVMHERGTGRQLAVLEVPLTGLRQAAGQGEGTVNDAFLAAVTGGLRRYHERHGVGIEALRVTPISIRRKDDPIGGNRITLQRLTVPVGVADPAQRMRLVHEVFAAARREPSLAVTNRIAGALNMLPPAYLTGVLKHVDFLASNVPGLSFPVYLGGAEMTDYFAFGPTIGASVNVTLMSYRGRCGIGINVDTSAVPDPEVLVECLREGFAEVMETAGQAEAAEQATERVPERRPTGVAR